MDIPTEKQKEQMKWDFVPEQKPDEVLILKFENTTAERDGRIAGGCPHGNPLLIGAEDEVEPRLSVECRVLAFWEQTWTLCCSSCYRSAANSSYFWSSSSKLHLEMYSLLSNLVIPRWLNWPL